MATIAAPTAIPAKNASSAHQSQSATAYLPHQSQSGIQPTSSNGPAPLI